MVVLASLWPNSSCAPMSRGWRIPLGCVALQRTKSAPCTGRLFGPQAIVQTPNLLAHLIEQAANGSGCAPGFMENLYLFIYPAYRPYNQQTSGFRSFSQKDVSARAGCIVVV